MARPFPFQTKAEENAHLIAPSCASGGVSTSVVPGLHGLVASADGLFQADAWHRRFSAKCDSSGEGLVSVIPCGFVEGKEESQLLVLQYFGFRWNCGDPGWPAVTFQGGLAFWRLWEKEPHSHKPGLWERAPRLPAKAGL